MVQPPEYNNHLPLLNKSFFKLITIIVGCILLFLLIASLILAALGSVRRSVRDGKLSAQVRGIVQGMATYAGDHNERFPGTDSKGFLLRDVDGDSADWMPLTKHGGTIEGRFWLMLNNNNFSGDYIISNAETKTTWTTGEVSSAHYSYAMLNIHSDGNALASDVVQPDQSARAREWKATVDARAVLLSDRARIPGGKIGDNYDKIYSIYTSEEEQVWAGNVAFGDGSAGFITDTLVDTYWTNGPGVKADRLFAKDQDSSRKIGKLIHPKSTWDDAANALLGYTSVGYDDGDIASE